MSSEPRKQFTFYRSFFLAAQQLPAKKRNEFVWTVIEYALDETEPKTKDSTVLSVFETVRPVLDKARNKALSGKTGGEASGKTRSKLEAKTKQNEASTKQTEFCFPQSAKQEREGEREGVRDRDRYIGDCFDFASIFDALAEAGVEVQDKDKEEIIHYAREYGDKAVREGIDKARENGANTWAYIRTVIYNGARTPRPRGKEPGYMRHGEPMSPMMQEAVRRMMEEVSDEHWPD